MEWQIDYSRVEEGFYFRKERQSARQPYTFPRLMTTVREALDSVDRLVHLRYSRAATRALFPQDRSTLDAMVERHNHAQRKSE